MGGIASAHLYTEYFFTVYRLMRQNDFQQALTVWRKTESLIPLLFEEPNSTPIKFMLRELGRIRSEEVRLPLLGISKTLQAKLDRHLIERPQ